MTSEPQACFVYIKLPGSLNFVTCGRFQHERLGDESAVGRFIYGRSYLERVDAVPLDPFNMPLGPAEYRTTKLGGMFGALRDVAPDYWGRLLIDSRYSGRDPSEFDYLTHPAEARIGALEFGPETAPHASSVGAIPGFDKLEQLREAALRIERGEPVSTVAAQLLDPGSSLGGARPKSAVRDEEGLWIAKFPQRGDLWSNAAVEGAMLRLAGRCGIRVPGVRLEEIGGEQVLLVKRFDREQIEDGLLRYRMVSMLTVLDLDESVTERAGWSYLDFADELQRWSVDPRADKRELFRRMVFNALISNSDDHPRNHALIEPGYGWRLSPAYDLTPSRAQSLERRDLALMVGALGRRASRQNLLSEAPRFEYTVEEANGVIDQVRDTIDAHWRDETLAIGGSEQDCNAVRNAFAYPGFDLVMD